ncbi:S8 family serine peptidase [Capilliphycus salinus ALCB114379]|uniref:S8 family serine peptidase n=1 Tax=Capilliphycus salinus TaxID=2768948 RepID=UPI0039A4C05D
MNTPKISPTFSPILRNIDPNCKQDAIVIYRSQRPPQEISSRGEQRIQKMEVQSQENSDVVAKVATSYQNATGQSLNVSKVGSGALPVAAVEVSQNTLPALAEQPEVVAVIPNQKIRLIKPQKIDYSDLIAQEEKQKMTWGLQVLDIPKMWETSKGKGVKVAVLDTGVYSDHPALKGRVKDFIIVDHPNGRRITATPHFDAGEHGTHVCGTIAGGKTDKGVSIGVAPEADLLAGGVLIGNATLQTLIEGMAWAIEKGANIINMSLGLTYYEPLFAEIFDIILNQFDVLPVVAIGNENHGNTSSPGSAYNAFSIGALEKYSDDELGIAFFSSGASLVFPQDSPNKWVTKPDVAAPGTQVYSCIPPVQQPDGIYQYTYMDGTSMATPHVAGVVALLMSACPKAPLSKIVEVLKETAYHPGGEEMRPDNRWGWGQIQPVKALEALK